MKNQTDDPTVLVIYLYTEYKKYCRFMYPKYYNTLTYKNKIGALFDKTNLPEIESQPTGEQVCAAGRQAGINLAREKDVDWILFLDMDLEPDPETIEKLLAVKHPVVGALVAARGDAYSVIGHNYKNRKTLEREHLRPSDVAKNNTVDGISGASLMIARGIYQRCDYTGYKGPATIQGRFTADDEYLQLRIFDKMKIKPKVASNCLQWHYDENGRAYKLWGHQKIWRAF